MLYALSQNSLIRRRFALCSWQYFHGCFKKKKKKDPSPSCSWSEANRCSVRALVGIVPLSGALQLGDSVEEMILCNQCCNCFCADTLSEEQQSTVGSITKNNDWFPAGLAQDKREQEHLWVWSAEGNFTPFETPRKWARTESPMALRAQGTLCPQATICNFNLGKSKGGSVVCTTYLNLFPDNNYCSL